MVGQAGGVAYLFGGRTANALKAKGVEPGVPDLLILEAGADGTHGLAVELKIDDNELTLEQADWLARARAKNWRCEVVRSFLEFVKVVQGHQSGITDLT